MLILLRLGLSFVILRGGEAINFHSSEQNLMAQLTQWMPRSRSSSTPSTTSPWRRAGTPSSPAWSTTWRVTRSVPTYHYCKSGVRNINQFGSALTGSCWLKRTLNGMNPALFSRVAQRNILKPETYFLLIVQLRERQGGARTGHPNTAKWNL